MHKILVICGPTATGKTKLALHVARQFDGELISADSRQIYKGLDALTGKDRPEASGEKIWMYDVIDPHEEFSVAHFQILARNAMNDIRSRGKLPILVGGTGLYLKAITQSLPSIHVPPNEKLREEFQNAPREELQKALQKADKRKWEQMNQSDRNNPRRLIRAIEIAQADVPFPPAQTELDILWIGLTAPFQFLEQRIAERIDGRWEKSLEEVKNLGFHNASSLPILGFSEIAQFLTGTFTADKAKRQWAMKERQYAKRQLTWFKKQPDIHWYDITKRDCQAQITKFVGAWYTKHV